MSRIYHKHMWLEKKAACRSRSAGTGRNNRGREEEVSYDGSRITAVIGSFRGREGVGVMRRDITSPSTAARSHTHSHLAVSPPVPENPPQSVIPHRAPLSSARLRLLQKKNQWNIFPPKWRGTMDVKVFLIREFTQKALTLFFFFFFFSASRLAEQSERGWKWGNNGWWVMKVTHFPLRRSLPSNINFITHNPGCQSTSDRLTSPPCFRPWPEDTSVFLPLSPPLMCKETCHCVLSYLTLKMEVETLRYCCIIERPSDVLAVGKWVR